MPSRELERFLYSWEREAKGTLELIRSLPDDRYDFRPDPHGRSLGELAWHLAEVEAYITFGIEQGRFDFQAKPPGFERPLTVAELAPGYERVHAESMARARKVRPEDMDRPIEFFSGSVMRVGDVLWGPLLHHSLHHRGQLVLMCRLAGGNPPGLFGPNREEMSAIRAKAKG